jgi:hypothetical protein
MSRRSRTTGGRISSSPTAAQTQLGRGARRSSSAAGSSSARRRLQEPAQVRAGENPHSGRTRAQEPTGPNQSRSDDRQVAAAEPLGHKECTLMAVEDRHPQCRRIGHRGRHRQLASRRRRLGRARRDRPRTRDRQGHHGGPRARPRASSASRSSPRAPPSPVGATVAIIDETASKPSGSTARSKRARGRRPRLQRPAPKSESKPLRLRPGPTSPHSPPPRPHGGGDHKRHAPGPQDSPPSTTMSTSPPSRHRPRRSHPRAGRARLRPARQRQRRRDQGAPTSPLRPLSPPRHVPARGARPVERMTPHAPAHRPAPRRGPAHRRDAHHLQRVRHERGDGSCASSTRTSSRRSTASAWVHVLLRQGRVPA